MLLSCGSWQVKTGLDQHNLVMTSWLRDCSVNCWAEIVRSMKLEQNQFVAVKPGALKTYLKRDIFAEVGRDMDRKVTKFNADEHYGVAIQRCLACRIYDSTICLRRLNMTDRYKVIVPEFADAKANGVIRKQADLMPVSTPKSRINDLLEITMTVVTNDFKGHRLLHWLRKRLPKRLNQNQTILTKPNSFQMG